MPTRTNRYARDYDAKAKERREAPLTIGGKEYHRRVKDNDVSRESRKLAGESQEELLAAAEKRQDMLDAEAGDKRRKLREAAEEHEERGFALLYDLAALLLVDEADKQPSADDLRAALELEEVNELTSTLMGVGEELEGPTATETS